MDKKITFMVDDPQFENIIGGNVEETKRYVENLLEILNEMTDGEEYTITIRRKDMTQEELDRAPDI